MFRLFGNLWLDDPPDSVLTALDGALPLIRNLQQNITHGMHRSSNWSMDAAFKCYREEEYAWWKLHNVERSRKYLVHPSGRLDATVACHLFNPTFEIDEPCDGEIDDPSNPCIAQLHDVGLSAGNCLIFDHSARREDSRHCKMLYPPDLWDIHEAFVFALRSNIEAVVEICWGANVRERMLRRLQNNMCTLPLWGRYEGVTLYLELGEDKTSVRRFIIFVNHPQFFMFLKGTNVRAQAFRTEQGGRQDLMLEVASCLGNIVINAGFYKLSPLLLRPFRPTKAIREQRDTLKGQAYAELKAAFPGATLISSVKGTLSLSQKDHNELQGTKLPVIEHILKEHKIVTKDNIANDKALEEIRLQNVARFWGELHDVAVMFMPDASFNFAKKLECQQLINTIEASEGELYHWEELPASLAGLIQSQDGLRIDQHPIGSRKEAETAYRLLHCNGSPETFSIVGLAFAILITYAWSICRTPRDAINDLMVLRASSKGIVPRVCSSCNGRVLDDPFAYYAKNNVDYYVVKSSQTGCGLIDCTGRRVLLHPLDRSQSYVRALKKNLENIPNFRTRGGAEWEQYFLRRGQAELGEIPRTVELKCPREGCTGILEDDAPRWTIHSVPTVVLRQFTCPDCQRKGDWKPVNTAIKYITSETLSRTWGRFKKKGCDLAQYPRLADVYFAQGHITIRIAQLKEAKRLADESNAN
ncbi:uncharacterized protein N7482_005680 [Penicillium canariense]|uniref:Uncharacterized protein n=1 Tax=Penicillium canariense TaxID=189055 RepID=A0A9W9LMH2_9EURO|nr:uncharacterized protein N7482_005680 [Penicillium canariense]KAJ5166899.1 hypothetical protein N7482_005680 [Penicillium canariense]